MSVDSWRGSVCFSLFAASPCRLSSLPTHAAAPSSLSIQVPPNGLVIYCGTILTDDNKEKQVTIDFEPFKPINTSLYLCDNKFHTEALAVSQSAPRATA